MQVMKKKWIVFLLTLPLQATWFGGLLQPTTTFTIMLEPSGDAHDTGRMIEDNFERGITLQCAQQVKEILEQRHPHVRVLLTRFPGETLQPLQNANFANRLDIQLYISLHFYAADEPYSHWYIYQFSYGHEITGALPDLAFYPYDRAYLINRTKTALWGTLIHQAAQQASRSVSCTVEGVYAIPFKPLIGIKAPALAFEIGLKSKDDWSTYSTRIADSLEPIIEKGAA
jgi:N-acetylmuramoyl-L-alanine amidase